MAVSEMAVYQQWNTFLRIVSIQSFGWFGVDLPNQKFKYQGPKSPGNIHTSGKFRLPQVLKKPTFEGILVVHTLGLQSTIYVVAAFAV